MDVKEFRTFGHQVVDLLAEYLEKSRQPDPEASLALQRLLQ